MKILIVEDEVEIATSIKNYLSSNDFICESASSLKTAIEKIDLYSYDCILLDLMLTDGDGFKILELLKKQNKTDGVIIISAKDTLETKTQQLKLSNKIDFGKLDLTNSILNQPINKTIFDKDLTLEKILFQYRLTDTEKSKLKRIWNTIYLEIESDNFLTEKILKKLIN